MTNNAPAPKAPRYILKVDGRPDVLVTIPETDHTVEDLAMNHARLIAMLRRLLTETPLVDEEDGEHPVIDQARALLAEVTPPRTRPGVPPLTTDG